MKRFDSADISQAGSYLEYELTKWLPKVYMKKYANLWADEGDIIPVSGTLDAYSQELEGEIVEVAGAAKEYTDKTDDITVVSSARTTDKFTVHTFAISTLYSIFELKAMEQARRNIKQLELVAVNRALRQSVHELLVFGSIPRQRRGLVNNLLVPTSISGYNPNSSTWQQHVDFLANTLTTIADRNNLTEGTAWILLPNKLRTIYGKTFEVGGGGRSVIDAIMQNFGTASGGSLKGFKAVNEVRSTYLERFNVKPVGSNQDRLVFLPDSADAIDKQIGTIDFIQPQVVDLTYKTIHFVTTSETMVHYPDSMQYEDVPRVL